jgi:molybdopterin/thiamine biosynthesis adenylyltransferase
MHRSLTDEERSIYEWQLGIPEFGEKGQEKLKTSSALVTRCGGLGGPLAYNLAAAGIGRLVVAHGGNVRRSDLNRQILMTDDWVGKPRIESIARRLGEFNPRMTIEPIGENVSEENAGDLVKRVDIVFDCAPLFEERFAFNRQCVSQRKPLIEAAMYGTEGQITTVLPGQTPCLACLYPEKPSEWKRQFPVLGAVSALAAALAAMEGLKVLAGLGETLAGTLLHFDTRRMRFRRIPIARRSSCSVCGSGYQGSITQV